MSQIGNVPEIVGTKRRFSLLKKKGLIKDWEVPYEELLTRLSAAIFFLSPSKESGLPEIWESLEEEREIDYRPNDEKKLSQLDWRVQFEEESK